MSKTHVVEIRTGRDERRYNTNEVLRNVHAMSVLREHGVPVIGAISIISVEFGRLTTWLEEGLDGDEFVYRWEGPADRVVVPSPKCTCEFPWHTRLPKPKTPVIDDDEEL